MTRRTDSSASADRPAAGGPVDDARGTRRLLRALPVLSHPPPPLGPEDEPPDPTQLFASWFAVAVHAGVVEPHAMVLSTVDGDGMPDARTLILKDLRDGAWWFATDASTAKAAQLARDPRASITFYWPTLGRQVRLRGGVSSGSATETRRDFDERGASSRAVVAAAQDVSADVTRDQFSAAVARRLREIEQDPTVGSEAWRLYGLRPVEIEFWQADPDRLHHRLRYTRGPEGWSRRRLAH